MTMLVHSRPLFCRVTGLEDATADIRIVRLAIVAGGFFRFAAGQYARVTFAGHGPRDYSLANRPGAAELEFHIRHRADGGAGAYAARTLRIGDSVWVEGPFGDAWLRRDHAGPILCIAGGSGLAPMKSIVETALAAEPDRSVDLYFGGRDEGDVYLEADFRRLEDRHVGFRYHVLLSEPRGATTRRRGTVVDGLLADADSASDGGRRLAGAKVYAAGPPAMVRAARAALLGLGLPAVDIHLDPFYTESQVAAARSAQARPPAQTGGGACRRREARQAKAEVMSFEAIELCRAERGSDLWTAIEAAQSSRVLAHDQVDGADEEQALTALGEALDRVVEAWDEEALQNKAPLLAILDNGLAALTPHGLSLYWGCVERRMTLADGEVMPMQVAVIAVSRSSEPTQRVAVPTVFDPSDVEEQFDDDASEI